MELFCIDRQTWILFGKWGNEIEQDRQTHTYSAASGRCCSSDFDLSDVILGLNNVAENFVCLVHVIDGPKDSNCFTKVGQCQLQISYESIQIVYSPRSLCSVNICFTQATLAHGHVQRWAAFHSTNDSDRLLSARSANVKTPIIHWFLAKNAFPLDLEIQRFIRQTKKAPGLRQIHWNLYCHNRSKKVETK